MSTAPTDLRPQQRVLCTARGSKNGAPCGNLPLKYPEPDPAGLCGWHRKQVGAGKVVKLLDGTILGGGEVVQFKLRSGGKLTMPCQATNRKTQMPCRAPAVPGEVVCKDHLGMRDLPASVLVNEANARKSAREQLTRLAEPATRALFDILEDPSAKHSDRLKAAEIILDRTVPRKLDVEHHEDVKRDLDLEILTILEGRRSDSIEAVAAELPATSPAPDAGPDSHPTPGPDASPDPVEAAKATLRSHGYDVEVVEDDDDHEFSGASEEEPDRGA